jgi:alkylated DNA nucleotide flippase Atl1
MSKGKYRGTTKYFHVLAELVRAAQYRGVTTYQDIAVIMGLPLTGGHMAGEVGKVLGEIATDEVAAGRPMLSSVAVNVNGKAGEGFYTLARTLGRLSKTEDELNFWESEREASYEAWKRPLPKTS